MQKLTKAEEEIMQVLWKLERGFLKEVMEAMPKPKPAQSTVSTLLRILEKKKFISHQAYGKSFQYFPLIGKEEYADQYLGNFIKNYFDGSREKLLSFFMRKNEVDLETLNELLTQNEEEDQA